MLLGVFKILSHADKAFPSPHTICRTTAKILREKIKIIGWLIFSCAAGATTKTAAVTNRTYGAIESLPSAFGLTLRVTIASVIDSPLRVSSSSADTKRRVAASRRLTKFQVRVKVLKSGIYLDGEFYLKQNSDIHLHL